MTPDQALAQLRREIAFHAASAARVVDHHAREWAPAYDYNVAEALRMYTVVRELTDALAVALRWRTNPQTKHPRHRLRGGRAS